jgi:hypothetical protein
MIDDLLQVKVSKLPTRVLGASTVSRADLSFSNAKNSSVHCCRRLDIPPSLYIPGYIPAHLPRTGHWPIGTIISTPIEVH